MGPRRCLSSLPRKTANLFGQGGTCDGAAHPSHEVQWFASAFASNDSLGSFCESNLGPDLRQRLHQMLDIGIGVMR
jgi:hypothetical protein